MKAIFTGEKRGGILSKPICHFKILTAMKHRQHGDVESVCLHQVEKISYF